MDFFIIFISSSSSLTGGRQTPPNPEKVEKVHAPFLEIILLHQAERLKFTHYICLRWSNSAAVVGGVFKERMRASWHTGGGLAGVAGGDPPPFCSILCVGEAMWRLLCRRGPGVCALAHTHTHHGGIHADALAKIPRSETVRDFCDLTRSSLISVQLMRTSFMKHELIELPFVEHSQCECR